MNNKFALNNTLGLKQRATQKLILVQSVLATSSQELEEKIEHELEENPMLEVEESTVDEASNSEENAVSMQTSNPDFSFAENGDGRLRNEPIDQLHNTNLSEGQILIGEEILGNLDANGYFKLSNEELQKILRDKFEMEVSPEEIENVRKIILKLEPTGLASRNLQECLIVQIDESVDDEKLKGIAVKMINEYFEDFRLHRYEKLADELNTSIGTIDKIFKLLNRLNPTPGKNLIDNENEIIYPDFIVTKANSELSVELTRRNLPQLRLNGIYDTLLKEKSTDKKTKEFLTGKKSSAKNFIDAVNSRRNVLMKIMNAIIDKQKNFFLKDEGTIKPLYEKDLADELHLDPSTISRAVKNKYVQTDKGIYELRHFFGNPINVSNSEDVSSSQVKSVMREIFENENKLKPLTDDDITEKLNEQGYEISRRTVAKYRESINISKASLRRKINLN